MGLSGLFGRGDPPDETRLDELERRLGRLERRLDLLMAHLGADASEDGEVPGEDEIRELLAKGQKIQAIRVYRERTGSGLREAKEAVEQIERLL
jgi:ribosomal protein L7/L12